MDKQQVIATLDACIDDGNAPGWYLEAMEQARALLAASESAKLEFKPVGGNEHMIVYGTTEVIDALKERLTHDYRMAESAPNPSVEPVALIAEQEREAFDTWARNIRLDASVGSNGHYTDAATAYAFAAWRARADLAAPLANPSDKQVTKITNAMLDAAVAAFKDRPEYSVRESMRAAIAASLPQSAEQEAVAEIVRYETFTGRTAWDIKIRDTSLKNGALLYAAPLAQSAEQDRIDAERYRHLCETGFIPRDFEKQIDAEIAKGASK